MCALLVAMQKQFALLTPDNASQAQQGRSYLWTHSSMSNKEHTSGTSNNKADHNKYTVT